MISLSPIKIMIILLVVLLVVGPDKLPQIARQVGEAWRALKSLSQRVEHEVRSSLPDLPSTGDLARFARSPVTLLDRLATMSNNDDALTPDVGADMAGEGSDAPLQPDPGAPAPSVRSQSSAPRDLPTSPAQPRPTQRSVAPQGFDPSLN